MQQGQVFELKKRAVDGRPVWAYRVGFAYSGGLVFVDESAEEVATLWANSDVRRRRVAASGGKRSSARCGLCSF